ncbi:MAG: hypothetical protein M3N08_07075 [Pseudomonadota bacterium]|nr:hypothetical protein [Pseudomonadota bacterium]
MIRQTAALVMTCLALSACASEAPRVVQASSSSPEIRLKSGLAAQVEMPHGMHVQSVVVGNPSLLSAERADTVVNLIPKEGSGETNLIARAVDEDGEAKVYQYRLFVQDR